MTKPAEPVNSELHSQLSEIVIEMLDGIADTSIPDAVLPMVNRHDELLIEATVDLLGAATARPIVAVPVAMSIGLTAAQTGLEPSDISLEDARGRVAELTNVLGGSVKSLIVEETALDVPESRVCEPTEATDGAIEVVHPLGTIRVTSSTPHSGRGDG